MKYLRYTQAVGQGMGPLITLYYPDYRTMSELKEILCTNDFR